MVGSHVPGDVQNGVNMDAVCILIVGKMPEPHRRFLLSFERGQPNWALLGLPHVAELPAVKWRQINLDTLTPDKRAALVANLEKALGE